MTQRKQPQAGRLARMKPPAGVRRWSIRGDAWYAFGDTADTLERGLYETGDSPFGFFLKRKRLVTDDLLRFPDSATAAVLAEIELFWQRKEEFSKRGLLHKRGVLLWGPQGSGKTACVVHLSEAIVQLGGIAVYLDCPDEAASCLAMIRQIEPDRPIVGLLEDIDTLIETYGESAYLSLLDGESQVGNIMFVATTNYPEKLDKRFLDRPSRFDTVQYVGMPSAELRRAYLHAKEETLRDGELDQWVQLSEGFSIAHLREMIVASRCLGRPIEEVVKRLELMHTRLPTSENPPDLYAKLGIAA